MPTKANPTPGEIPPNEFDELIDVISRDGGSGRSADIAMSSMKKWSEKRREAQEAFNRIETELVRSLAHRVARAEGIAEDAKVMKELGDRFDEMMGAVAEHLRSYPPGLFESRYDVPDSLRELKENFDATCAKLALIRGDDG
jgi:hypothetical protein